jgi:hypothetical protein
LYNNNRLLIATEGQEYEGWFEDKMRCIMIFLSVGKFNQNNALIINQTMVNPYTYTIFYVTAEPLDDLDPRSGGVIVAAKMPWNVKIYN